MLAGETWRVAFEALWSNKLRAFLTTLGVVIGSACIVLVVTVAVAGRSYVISQIEGVGSNLVYANYEVNPQQALVMSNEITLADMNAIKAVIREWSRRRARAACRRPWLPKASSAASRWWARPMAFRRSAICASCKAVFWTPTTCSRATRFA